MRVYQRGAGLVTLVLEDQHILEAVIPAQVGHAMAIGPDDIRDVCLGQISQLQLMIRRLNDHLVRAHADILSNMPTPSRSILPSIRSTGYLFGKTRTRHPRVFGAVPGSRTAKISCGSWDSSPPQKTQGAGGRLASGPAARSGLRARSGQ